MALDQPNAVSTRCRLDGGGGVSASRLRTEYSPRSPRKGETGRTAEPGSAGTVNQGPAPRCRSGRWSPGCTRIQVTAAHGIQRSTFPRRITTRYRSVESGTRAAMPVNSGRHQPRPDEGLGSAPTSVGRATSTCVRGARGRLHATGRHHSHPRSRACRAAATRLEAPSLLIASDK